MKQRIVGFCFACALSLAFVTLPTGMFAADDTKSTAKDPPTKIPDYSKYKYAKEVTGEVVKADDKNLTVRIKWVEQKGAPQKGRPPMLTEKQKDYDFPFIPESLVRTMHLPPKTDDKGKKIPYTDKEKEALKQPPRVTGYAAQISDLVAGSTVDVILIRDKSIPDDKVTDSDLRVKYAIIQAPPAKKDEPKKDDTKKN